MTTRHGGIRNISHNTFDNFTKEFMLNLKFEKANLLGMRDVHCIRIGSKVDTYHEAYKTTQHQFKQEAWFVPAWHLTKKIHQLHDDILYNSTDDNETHSVAPPKSPAKHFDKENSSSQLEKEFMVLLKFLRTEGLSSYF